MEAITILATDSSKALMYQLDPVSLSLQYIRQYSHSESRLKAYDLKTDGPGQIQSGGRFSVRRSSYQNSSDPNEVEETKFARELNSALMDNLRSDQNQTFIVAAPPHFLGMLRKQLDPQVRNKIKVSIDKDLVHMDAFTLMNSVLKNLNKSQKKELGLN